MEWLNWPYCIISAIAGCVCVNVMSVWLTDTSEGRVNDSSGDHDLGDHVDSAGCTADAGSSGDGPFVVIYMVDSFTYGSQAGGDIDDAAAARLATVGLLQCYSGMLKAIPDHLQSSIQLQVSVCHCLVCACMLYYCNMVR